MNIMLKVFIYFLIIFIFFNLYYIDFIFIVMGRGHFGGMWPPEVYIIITALIKLPFQLLFLLFY